MERRYTEQTRHLTTTVPCTKECFDIQFAGRHIPQCRRLATRPARTIQNRCRTNGGKTWQKETPTEENILISKYEVKQTNFSPTHSYPYLQFRYVTPKRWNKRVHTSSCVCIVASRLHAPVSALTVYRGQAQLRLVEHLMRLFTYRYFELASKTKNIQVKMKCIDCGNDRIKKVGWW